MKLWTDFFDYLLPDVPGCPFIAATFALRQSAISFCEQSLCWRYQHPDISVTNGVAQYAFAPPEGATVHAITYAEFNGKEIETRRGETGMYVNDWRNETGIPAYVLGGELALRIVPEPDVEGTLKLEVALKPSPDAENVNDLIFNEYREAIVHGAHGRLMLSPKKPYTNAQLAQFHQQQFQIQATEAGTRTARNYTRAPLQSAISKRGV